MESTVVMVEVAVSIVASLVKWDIIHLLLMLNFIMLVNNFMFFLCHFF